MEEFIKDALPYILMIIGAIAYIIYKSKDSIVKMFKNKADGGEVAVKALEEKLAQDRKKDEIKDDAQNFLSDVGRNYFTILAEEAEGLRSQLTDSEGANAELEAQLQEAILKREEFRIKYTTVNESYQESKERLVFLESDNIKKDLLLKELEDTVGRQKNVVKQMEEGLAAKDSTLDDLKLRLAKAETDKGLAEKRFDEERKQNDMLLEENRKLREDK